jgi:hypothetical protein
MGMRSVVFWSLAALLVGLGGGCGKSTPGEGAAGRPPSNLSAPPAAETAGRLHWIGMKRLAAETNAASFLKVWTLPETAKLEAQTLDKLALWLGTGGQVSVTSNRLAGNSNQLSVIGNQSPVANHPVAALLRPLLGDLVQEESYLEIRSGTNQFGELALAIRLEDPRARLWQTNLAAAFESLTGTRPTPVTNGWTAQVQSPKTKVSGQSSVVGGQSSVFSSQSSVVVGQWSVALTRSGDWTILGALVSPVTNQPSPVTNLLVADFAVRIRRNQTPELGAGPRLAVDPVTRSAQSAPSEPGRGVWLETAVNLERVADFWRFSGPRSSTTNTQSVGWPTVLLSVTGDGEEVLTGSLLTFPRALPLELEAWTMPTNLVSEPLASFTAIRGLGPWVSSLKAWRELGAGDLPNQLYLWSRSVNAYGMYWVAPLANASRRVEQVTQRLLQRANPWITNNTYGRIEPATGSNGVVWAGVSYMQPFLRTASAAEGSLVIGGLIPYVPTNQPLPAKSFAPVLTRTNLIYYDWELTGYRTDALLPVGQLCRLLFRRPQLPSAAGMKWLNAAGPRLGNCVTTITRNGPAQVSLSRKSSVGLTGFELHLLADWLESPEFPRRPNTLVGPKLQWFKPKIVPGGRKGGKKP